MTPSKPAGDADLDALIDAVAAQVGLPIAPEHRPGVRQFLAIAAEMAEALDGATLDPDELAPAPVYRLPEPEDAR